MHFGLVQQACKLQATLVRNSAHRLTYSLTGVKCRATSVAKNLLESEFDIVIVEQ